MDVPRRPFWFHVRRHCTADDLSPSAAQKGLDLNPREQTPDGNVLPHAGVLSPAVSVWVSVVSVRRRLRSTGDPCLGWSELMVTSGKHAFADLESVLTRSTTLTAWWSVHPIDSPAQTKPLPEVGSALGSARDRSPETGKWLEGHDNALAQQPSRDDHLLVGVQVWQIHGPERGTGQDDRQSVVGDRRPSHD